MAGGWEGLHSFCVYDLPQIHNGWIFTTPPPPASPTSLFFFNEWFYYLRLLYRVRLRFRIISRAAVCKHFDPRPRICHEDWPPSIGTHDNCLDYMLDVTRTLIDFRRLAKKKTEDDFLTSGKKRDLAKNKIPTHLCFETHSFCGPLMCNNMQFIFIYITFLSLLLFSSILNLKFFFFLSKPKFTIQE